MATTASTFPTLTLAAALTRSTQKAQAELDKFKESLTSNPAYAMEWSQRAFDSAATIEVNALLLGYMGHDGLTGEPGENAAKTMEDSNVVFERTKMFVINEVIRRSCGINNTSSSQTGNVMERSRLSRFSNVAHELTRGW